MTQEHKLVWTGVAVFSIILGLLVTLFVAINDTMVENEIRAGERQSSIQYSARRTPYILDCFQGKVFVIIQQSSGVRTMFATGDECDRIQFLIDNNIL